MLKRLGVFCLALICMLGLWGLTAPMARAEQDPHTTQVPPGLQVEADRFQAVLECLPKQLGLAASDPGSRIAQVFDEWGKDQFERAMGLTDDPQLTQAEQEFEACLEDKGITPMRKLQQTA